MTGTIVDQYLKGLEERLSEEDKALLSYTEGATGTQLEQLKARFPQCPATLIELLSRINGTYWQPYGDKEVCLLMLGSDVLEYPYYLKSVEQIVGPSLYDGSINQIYGDDLIEMSGLTGEGIDPDIDIGQWLCFSDCMNNGGTSQLYIDFNPAPGGVSGQVIRFLHDPDSFEVIARDFDEYLRKLIDNGYNFIHYDED